ncbi:sigma-70 family RNA polymerase sigma factor [Fulvivirgaceae bacterium PWU4]|uniref:Sigma-70 family RNA polymerase sigma factor n=1 Tax=Chryseosolibacter histidini TaxID=2782349 RepID=A0AAP2DUH9_9BACT|nr:sigma-70 family RNA polymerase sigma factor [Chryseosolibacter histidini]MBT1701563.1 sigma-70 family RNA polymerase sigma factor [Chryseosolibacter histidini]
MTHAQTIALYQPTLHAIAMKLLRCKADAEDIVQETFIKWLDAEHEKIKNTKAYLVRAVTNNCLNHLEALKKKKEEYLESFHWPHFIEKFRDSDFTHIDLENKLTKAFHVLQHKLEPLERAVYVLKEAFDFDYKAIQELLDKKQDHCRQLFCRARKKLDQEKERLNAAIHEKTALMKSFKESCDVGHATEFIAELRNDITSALRKKS